MDIGRIQYTVVKEAKHNFTLAIRKTKCCVHPIFSVLLLKKKPMMWGQKDKFIRLCKNNTVFRKLKCIGWSCRWILKVKIYVVNASNKNKYFYENNTEL